MCRKGGNVDERTETLLLITQLFNSQHLSVVATQNRGQPHQSLVAFMHRDELRHLFFATSRSTRKYEYIRRDDRVCVLVDNRLNRDADFHSAVTVSAYGRASEVEKTEDLIQEYLEKFPYLEDFVTAPTCALMKISVEKYIIVRRFQNVTEVDIDS